eukprot:m.33936 g.33936  ORF g.33936 m.33936 type:complete len:819 (-) comp9702_c0_seq1:294-2750(-)
MEVADMAVAAEVEAEQEKAQQAEENQAASDASSSPDTAPISSSDANGTAATTPTGHPTPTAPGTNTDDQTAVSEETMKQIEGLSALVKIFELHDGDWVESTTGNITAFAGEQGLGFVVRDADSDVEALRFTIKGRQNFFRQSAALFLWSEPDGSTYSLSFEFQDMCSKFWNLIVENGGDIAPEDTTSPPRSPRQRSRSVTPNNDMILPPLEMSTLPQWKEFARRLLDQRGETLNISEDTARIMVQQQLYAFGEFVCHQNILTSLLNVFETCDDLEDTASLATLHDIALLMLLTAETALYDSIFTHDVLFKFIGILEQHSEANRTDYRKYLEEQTVFLQVHPIESEELRANIERAYWLQYLKDVVLAGVIDDYMLPTLDSMLHFIYADIAREVAETPDYLETVLALNAAAASETQPTGSERLEMQGKFLVDLFHVGVGSQDFALKRELLQILIQKGCLRTVVAIVKCTEPRIRFSGARALWKALECGVGALRRALVTNWGLVSAICDAITKETHFGALVLWKNILEAMFDVETFCEDEGMLKADMLEKLYDEETDTFKHLLSVFSIPDGQPLAAIQRERQLAVLQLIGLWIEHHTFHIRNLMLTDNLLPLVASALKTKNKLVSIAVLQIVTQIVKSQHEFLIKRLIRTDMLKHLMTLYAENGARNNMFNSTVLNFVSQVMELRVLSLQDHLVERFRPQLEAVPNMAPCAKLVLRYEQRHEPPAEAEPETVAAAAAAETETRTKRDGSMDTKEEAYFDDDGQADSGPPTIVQEDANAPELFKKPPPHLKPLVDYDDDEDEDGFSSITAKKPKLTFKLSSS